MPCNPLPTEPSDLYVEGLFLGNANGLAPNNFLLGIDVAIDDAC